VTEQEQATTQMGVRIGVSISAAADNAVQIAQITGAAVCFEFNGISLTALPAAMLGKAGVVVDEYMRRNSARATEQRHRAIKKATGATVADIVLKLKAFSAKLNESGDHYWTNVVRDLDNLIAEIEQEAEQDG